MRSHPAHTRLQAGRQHSSDDWAEDIEEDEFLTLPEGEWLADEWLADEWLADEWLADEWLADEWLAEEAWPVEDEWLAGDDEWQAVAYEWQPPNMLVVILAACLVMVGALTGLLHLAGSAPVEQVPGTAVASSLAGAPGRLAVGDPTTVVSPYDEYTLTQGLHGQSYGHLAVDLAAGRGEPVKSPINGFVTNLYVDEYGNTTLVLENDVYIVTMLHGDFAVAIGDEVSAGQIVGSEGNNGYTMDFFGNLCYGRVYCGNHTHLNMYDKRIWANVNPLDLLP